MIYEQRMKEKWVWNEWRETHIENIYMKYVLRLKKITNDDRSNVDDYGYSTLYTILNFDETMG